MLNRIFCYVLASILTAAFTGLICNLLWAFFWHGFVWALFVLAVFWIVLFVVACFQELAAQW